MKSISLKVTVWSVAALILSLAAFLLIGDSVVGRSANQNFTQFNHVLFRQAIAAYRAGGANGLSSFLRELNRPGAVQFYLCDSRGRDLEHGADLSALVQETVGSHRPYFKNRNSITMGLSSEDGRYFWLVSSPAPSFSLFAPFYVLLLVTVAVLFWLITANIARPLRHLAQVVDRFGQGDLKARSNAKSKDEIGNLSRSFNAMAERIQTLLKTERQLLQDVSHELRSPLTSVKGFTATLLNKWDRFNDEQRLLMLQTVNADADRVTRLIAELLDVSRIDAGRLELHKQVVDVPAAVRRLISGRVASGDPPERFEVVAATLLPEMWLDPDKLDQVLANLVDNAIRHGAGTVTVTIAATDDGIVLTVADEGDGVAADIRNLVFRRFWRAGRRGGTGLGLYIVKGLVEAHGGQVAVLDAPAGGASFRISLPTGTPAFAL